MAVWILGTPSNLCRPEYGFPFLDLANWPGYMAMMAMSGYEPIFNADKDRLRVATFFPWRIFFQKIAKFSCMNIEHMYFFDKCIWVKLLYKRGLGLTWFGCSVVWV